MLHNRHRDAFYIWGGQTSAIIHEILNTAELIIMYPLGVLITAFKFKYILSHAMGGPFPIPVRIWILTLLVAYPILLMHFLERVFLLLVLFYFWH